MGHRLPAIRFTLRMVPADHHDSLSCLRFSMHLCYAFPFFRTLKGGDKWWIQVMGGEVAGFLSHETTLSLGLYGGLIPSPGNAYVREAQAALFNIYFSAYLDNRLLASALRAVILPPMDYGKSLRGDSWADRHMDVGFQMAALALRKGLGGERLICPGDAHGLRTYRKILYRALHDPRWLDSLRKAAEQSLSVPYPDHSRLPLLLPHGRHIAVPLKDFAYVHGNQVDLYGWALLWSRKSKYFLKHVKHIPLSLRELGRHCGPRDGS